MPPTYEATDPKTGQKWTWDGKKWNPVATPTGVDKFGMDVAKGMGFDPDKIRSAYSKGGTFGQVKELGGEALTGLKDFAGRVAMDPFHIVDPLHAMASSLTHGLGLPDKPGEPFHSPVPGEAVGAAANILGGAEARERIPSVSGKAAVRDVLGVGEKDVEGFTKKAATKEETAHAKALEKVEKAKENYAGAVSEALKKRAEASAKETAAKTKQEALASKHGPVYQRMNEMADSAQKHIGEIEQKVHDAESKKWDAFKEKVGNPPVETQGIVDAITDAQKNILTGESLPVFRQILGEVTKDEAPEFIDEAGGIVPKGADISLDLARRLYTKIGRKLGGSELPRDVARALVKVNDSLDSGIAQGILQAGSKVSKEGKYEQSYKAASALREYRQLQEDWSQYRNTFSDRDSPLRKIVEAKDPSTKLGPITGETGARAVEYLGRYRDMGAQPEQLGKIRALHKALKELPGSGGKLPATPERPTLPEVPAKKTITPEQARSSMLESKGQFYSRPPSKWELMFPPLLIYKQTLKHLLQNKEFRNWLSKDNPPTPAT